MLVISVVASQLVMALEVCLASVFFLLKKNFIFVVEEELAYDSINSWDQDST